MVRREVRIDRLVVVVVVAAAVQEEEEETEGGKRVVSRSSRVQERHGTELCGDINQGSSVLGISSSSLTHRPFFLHLITSTFLPLREPTPPYSRPP